jgi:hypothetical protein
MFLGILNIIVQYALGNVILGPVTAAVKWTTRIGFISSVMWTYHAYHMDGVYAFSFFISILQLLYVMHVLRKIEQEDQHSSE